MRARGRGMTWWARTAQKSGSRLLPNAAIGVWLWKVFKERAMLTGKIGQSEAPCALSWPIQPGDTAQRRPQPRKPGTRHVVSVHLTIALAPQLGIQTHVLRLYRV